MHTHKRLSAVFAVTNHACGIPGRGNRKQAAVVRHLDEEGESPVELAREDAATWPA